MSIKPSIHNFEIGERKEKLISSVRVASTALTILALNDDTTIYCSCWDWEYKLENLCEKNTCQ